MKKFLCLVILIISLSYIKVDAAGMEITDNKCFVDYLYARLISQDFRKNNKAVEINFYNFYKSYSDAYNRVNSYGQAYCLKPGAHSYAIYTGDGHNANSNYGRHKCERVINPEDSSDLKKQAFDVAITRAYQLMIKKGIIASTTDSGTARSFCYTVGTIAFRWIASYFGVLEKYTNYDAKFNAFSYSNWKNANYWNNTEEVKMARTIVANAINNGKKILKKKKTYEQLVKGGALWTDQWSGTVNRIGQVDVVKNDKGEVLYEDVILNITVSVKDAKLRPSKVNWDGFSFEAKDGSKVVSFSRIVPEGEKNPPKNSADFRLKIRKTDGSWDKYYNLAIVQVNYSDQRNPNAHIMIVTPSAEGHDKDQKFIIIVNNDTSFDIKRKTIWQPEESTSCTCKYDDETDAWTGKYVLRKYKDGQLESKELLDAGDEKLSGAGCPNDCGNEPEEPHDCERVTNADGTVTYYGPEDENGASKSISQADFKTQCLHICETPEQNDEGFYYCADPGDDTDGSICTEEEYTQECYCNPMRDTCEADPDAEGCEDYETKCPGCSAYSSIPSTCNEFSENSNIVGTISDINRVDNTCNLSVNNVKNCVLGKSDMAGTSFEATKVLNGNRYCKLYCEEEYKFTVPTARHSTSGGYFTLQTSITGTRNCYTASASDPEKGIDIDKFAKDLEDLNNDLMKKWNSWIRYYACLLGTGDEEASDTKKTYTCVDYIKILGRNAETNEVTTQTVKGEKVTTSKNNLITKEANAKTKYLNTINTMSLYISNLDACTSWVNNADSDINFQPIITYNYDNYGFDSVAGTFTMLGEAAVSNSVSYCAGDVNSQYECTELPTATNPIDTSNYVYLYCNDSGCSWNALGVSLASWVKKTSTKSATFIPNQSFNTYHQYGTVMAGELCAGTSYNTCLWTRLPADALPVELKKGEGAYKFSLHFGNIGQSNSDNSLGRLIGSDYSVLNAYNNSDIVKCPMNENADGPASYSETLDQNVGYVCGYINNCDECKVNCSTENCDLVPTCGEGECPVKCKTCIFDGESANYKFRTISLNNVFPNSCSYGVLNCRNEGYNWQTLKGQVTKLSIEEAGSSVYENPEYSYTLTPSQIMEIRNYNSYAGTYENTTMPMDGRNSYNCQKVNYNGLDYSVNCVSEFLNDVTGSYFTPIVRNATGFRLWTETEYCFNGSCLSRSDGIGPSWK